MNDEEKKEGLEIIEEDAFEPEISDEELEQFYEDNKDAIDLIGGLDMFESSSLFSFLTMKPLYNLNLKFFNFLQKRFMNQNPFQSLEHLPSHKDIHKKPQKQTLNWQSVPLMKLISYLKLKKISSKKSIQWQVIN